MNMIDWNAVCTVILSFSQEQSRKKTFRIKKHLRAFHHYSTEVFCYTMPFQQVLSCIL